ncbi:MAG: thiol-disulfide oxidoreductase DCC family protein [Fimbriimonadaceae bacterium]
MATDLATENAEVRKVATADGPIVFYDGDCGLCARSVQFVLRKDKKHIFRFAPLQGETAAKLIGTPTGKPDTWTLILLDETGVYDRSTGALRILLLAKWGWILPKVALLVPLFVREAAYRLVAKVRYRVWGHADSCPLPTKSQMTRFMP